ncbi:hypothetical protein H0V99_03665 [Candidatus Saccharibacteria bacterium]|nr:hypothetical protein [Candidatus Saccharibacteria bacterium]
MGNTYALMGTTYKLLAFLKIEDYVGIMNNYPGVEPGKFRSAAIESGDHIEQLPEAVYNELLENPRTVSPVREQLAVSIRADAVRIKDRLVNYNIQPNAVLVLSETQTVTRSKKLIKRLMDIPDVEIKTETVRAWVVNARAKREAVQTNNFWDYGALPQIKISHNGLAIDENGLIHYYTDKPHIIRQDQSANGEPRQQYFSQVPASTSELQTPLRSLQLASDYNLIGLHAINSSIPDMFFQPAYMEWHRDTARLFNSIPLSAGHTRPQDAA